MHPPPSPRLRRAAPAATTVALWVLFSGCSSHPAARLPLAPAAELVVIEAGPATVSDERPRSRVGFRDSEGHITPVDREATAFVPRWRDGAALIDPTGRLYQVWRNGERRMLAAEVTTLATDTQRLAFVVREDLEFSLRVNDGGQTVTWADHLGSAGMLRVEPDRVLFVGAAAGGVAGVWVADAEGARCVTNCDLRAGQPWGGRFVPPPSSPAELSAP